MLEEPESHQAVGGTWQFAMPPPPFSVDVTRASECDAAGRERQVSELFVELHRLEISWAKDSVCRILQTRWNFPHVPSLNIAISRSP